MTTDDEPGNDKQQADAARRHLVTLALTAAALGLAIATLVLGILTDESEGASPLLTLAVVALALNGLRNVERNGG